MKRLVTLSLLCVATLATHLGAAETPGTATNAPNTSTSAGTNSEDLQRLRDQIAQQAKLDRRRREPREWQEAAQLGDDMVYLTAAELVDLSTQMRDLLKPYLERTTRPARRPEDARIVSVLHLAFPLPDAEESG